MPACIFFLFYLSTLSILDTRPLNLRVGCLLVCLSILKEKYTTENVAIPDVGAKCQENNDVD